MRIEVKVPQLPESVAEATLVNWHKKAGESVKRDENLIDIETDKVVLELPAPNDGVLAEITRPDGSTVTSNDVIAVIDTDAKGAAAPAAPEKVAANAPAAAGSAVPTTAAASAPPPAPPSTRVARVGDAVTALPAARRRLRTSGDPVPSSRTVPRTSSATIPASGTSCGGRMGLPPAPNSCAR